MFQQNGDRPLREHKELEAILHRELMNYLRKHLNRLGIVSVIGIMDIVKQEIIELEKATKRSMDAVQEDIEDNSINNH